MVSKIQEIEDDELIEIGGTVYARVPRSWFKSIGLSNIDGTKTTKKIKRAKIEGKNGVFMGIWGEFQKKN